MCKLHLKNHKEKFKAVFCIVLSAMEKMHKQCETLSSNIETMRRKT